MTLSSPPFKCLYCLKEKPEATFSTLEHIIPESLGNKEYILPKGYVCNQCQNYFSHIENKVLNSVPFIWERIQASTLTKKNKNARFERSGMKFTSLDNRPNLDIDPARFGKNDFGIDNATGLVNIHIHEQHSLKTLNTNYLRFLLKMGLAFVFFIEDNSKLKDNQLLNPYGLHFNQGRSFARQPSRGATWCLSVGYLDKKNWLNPGQYEVKLNLNYHTLIFRFRYSFISLACNLLQASLDHQLSTLEEVLILRDSQIYSVTI